MSSDAAAKVALLGLAPSVVDSTVKNAKLTAALCDELDALAITAPLDKKIGAMFYNIVSRLPSAAYVRHVLSAYVLPGALKSTTQLEAAVAYAAKLHAETEFEASHFESECGIGVVVSDDEIVKATRAAIEGLKAQLLASRAKPPVGLVLRKVNADLKWADGAVVKKIVDAEVKAFLDSTPDAAADAAASSGSAPAAAAATATAAAAPTAEAEAAARDRWPLPQDNPYNKPEILAAHLKRTGGQVRTRFPPEPNGYLHVGHAKAMSIDFGQAAQYAGTCVLRFDDTNPYAEKQEYIDNVIENVHWMGYQESAVTYSSDYFDKLHELAVELIKRGKAYVDHLPSTLIAEQREKKQNSPWRDRPIEENLREFERMRQGAYAEGEAVLRMKMDMQNANPCMRDLVAYRVLFTPHPHIGDRWCIYPSYDFTHCIVDSLEDITHSLCTTEFNPRRESYYWLLDALDMYKPIVWEYSRLNLTQIVVSKRKLKALVDQHIVRGWDDPRMPTLVGMRRRGFTPAGIRALTDLVGVTRSDNTVIEFDVLEHCVRLDLDQVAPRTFIVLNPLKVVLTNWNDDEVEIRKAPLIPRDKHSATYDMPFSKVVYIDRSDFREKDSKGFFGLTPGKEVNLKYSYNITCTEVLRDSNGAVAELRATVDRTHARKPKGHLHWVAEPRPGVAPMTAEVRLFGPLFRDNVESDDLRAQFNAKSEIVVKNALVVPCMRDAKVLDKFQAERVGYFCIDKESTPSSLVLNRTMTLADSVSYEVFNEAIDIVAADLDAGSLPDGFINVKEAYTATFADSVVRIRCGDAPRGKKSELRWVVEVGSRVVLGEWAKIDMTWAHTPHSIASMYFNQPFRSATMPAFWWVPASAAFSANAQFVACDSFDAADAEACVLPMPKTRDWLEAIAAGPVKGLAKFAKEALADTNLSVFAAPHQFKPSLPTLITLCVKGELVTVKMANAGLPSVVNRPVLRYSTHARTKFLSAESL